MQPLDPGFFMRTDVVNLARELLGKILFTHFDGVRTAGRIVETEAYAGINDRASHAFGGKRTLRTEIMYLPGAHAYVYLCYGMHHLFNIVTGPANLPHAVLIRALEPLEGIVTMQQRTGKSQWDLSITRGPGNLSRALGIQTRHSGMSLLGEQIGIADDGYQYQQGQMVIAPRIGVAYAGEDADLPYRFYIRNQPFVSGKK